jgi:hypothetical protein
MNESIAGKSKKSEGKNSDNFDGKHFSNIVVRERVAGILWKLGKALLEYCGSEGKRCWNIIDVR